MSLTINLATRGRPGLLIETVRRTLPLMTEDDTRLVISVDDDDMETWEALALLPSDPRIVKDMRPREDSVGAKWNRAVDYPADFYMPMADYAPAMTPGFDRMISDAGKVFPDGIGAVYGPLFCASFPSVQAISHGLVQKFGGKMYREIFPYWFVDHWVDDVVRMIDRVAFVDIDWDIWTHKPETQEKREPAFWATFFDSLRLVRRAEARRIIDGADFLEPEWRKQVLREHHPLIEFRSQWVNQLVAGYPATAPGDGGARYTRLRAAAVEMMMRESPALIAELEAA